MCTDRFVVAGAGESSFWTVVWVQLDFGGAAWAASLWAAITLFPGRVLGYARVCSTL